MTAYIDIFKRKEMKYCLDADQRQILEAKIANRMVVGEFGESKIRSLYYDTPEFALIERSLDKPLYKEKLRLRIYGQPSPLVMSFVELKKKFKGVVYKRRVAMSLRAAQAFLDEGATYQEACRAFPLLDKEAQERSLTPAARQIAREIEFLMQRYGNLAPTMLISCDRKAYADPEDGELRITFDDHLACAYGAQDAFAAPEALLIDPTRSIMEVKNAGPLPFWLVHALDRANAYPQSLSKYGRAYMNLRKDDKSA